MLLTVRVGERQQQQRKNTYFLTVQFFVPRLDHMPLLLDSMCTECSKIGSKSSTLSPNIISLLQQLLTDTGTVYISGHWSGVLYECLLALNPFVTEIERLLDTVKRNELDLDERATCDEVREGRARRDAAFWRCHICCRRGEFSRHLLFCPTQGKHNSLKD